MNTRYERHVAGGCRRTLFTIAALALLVCIANVGLAETITVDGTSIQEAVNAAKAGDTVVVIGDSEAAPRLYAERVNFKRSSGAGVTVVARPRRSVLMYGFSTRGAGDTLTIEGFQITIPEAVFTKERARVALLVESNHVLIKDNYFFDIPGWGILSGNKEKWVGGRVIGNHLYRCGSGIVIFGDDWLVEGNEVERNVWNPIAGGIDADYSRAFGTNITIRRNYFHGTIRSEIGKSHVDGFQSFDHNRTVLRNFVFEENIVSHFGQGVIITSKRGLIGDITIRNNVFDGGGVGATGILIKEQVSNFSATHNLIANMKHHGIILKGGPEGTVQDNIFYNAGSNYRASPDSTLVGGHNLINVERFPFYSEATDLVRADPLFTDADNWLGADGIPFSKDDGYTVRADSRAVGAASDGGNIGPTIPLSDLSTSSPSDDGETDAP